MMTSSAFGSPPLAFIAAAREAALHRSFITFGSAKPPPPPLPVPPIPPAPRPVPVPPMPPMRFGTTVVALGMVTISGSAIFESPLVVMRLACAGALMVFFFFAIETLCSSARLLAFTTGGPPWKESLRFA